MLKYYVDYINFWLFFIRQAKEVEIRREGIYYNKNCGVLTEAGFQGCIDSGETGVKGLDGVLMVTGGEGRPHHGNKPGPAGSWSRPPSERSPKMTSFMIPPTSWRTASRQVCPWGVSS